MGPLPLADAAKLHLAMLRATNKAPDTLDGYARVERRFERFVSELGQSPTVAALTVANARLFYGHLVESGCSAATGHHYLTILRIWAGFLARDDDELGRPILRSNPLEKLSMPKLPQKEIDLLSRDEVARMVRLAGNGRNAYRNQSIVLFMADTGLRISEVCSVEAARLVTATDKAPGRYKVLGKGAKERTVYFGGKASAALLRYQHAERPKVDEAKLFLSEYRRPWSTDAVRKMIDGLAAAAGIVDKEIHPHSLRHFAATEWARAGMSVYVIQALLGHSTLEMSKRYTHLVQRDIEAQYESQVDRWADVRVPSRKKRGEKGA